MTVAARLEVGIEAVPDVAYWCSHPHVRRLTPFQGRAHTFFGAMLACELDHGASLAWQEVARGQYSARAGETVYTVRCEK